MTEGWQWQENGVWSALSWGQPVFGCCVWLSSEALDREWIYVVGGGWTRAKKEEMDWECWSRSSFKLWSPVLWVLEDVIIIMLLKDITNPITLIVLWLLLHLIYYLFYSKHILLKAKPECLPTLKTFQTKIFGSFPSWPVSLLTMARHMEVCLILLIGREVCCRAGRGNHWHVKQFPVMFEPLKLPKEGREHS